jgi:acetoin utilization protein AcuB
MAIESVRPRPRLLAPNKPGAVRSHDDILDGTTVGEIMSRNLRSIATDAELWEARAQFEHYGIHHLFVDDRGYAVAIISDRDVLRAISPYADTNASQRRDEATLHRRVFQAASYHLITVHESALVQEAAAMLIEHKISCLPVVDDDDHIVGIVTIRDLLRGMLECLVPSSGAA